MLTERIDTYAELSGRIASLPDDTVIDLLQRSEEREGWGLTRTIEIAGHPVFVKTLPVTALAERDPFGTANIHRLPVVYQYGVGSAGFGAGRELAAHLTANQWVIEEGSEHFPLLYHHRLLPLSGQTRQFDATQLERYVQYWGGDDAIGSFVVARQESRRSIVLFLEHIPDVLMDWLPEHQDDVGALIGQALEVTDFLRERNVAHFDANPSNILIDDGRIVFADFGLVLDETFDLDAAEQDFLARHRQFDIGEFLASLEWPTPGREFERGEAFRAAVEPYRAVIDEMTAVFERLQRGPTTSCGYDDERIARLMADARR